MAAPRLSALKSALLVIDIQDKLLARMPDAAGLVRNASFCIDVAKLFGVPVFATEQYPKGLGPTTEAIAQRLAGELPSKVAFSCCGAPGVLAEIRTSGKKSLVLVGMEAHVCVLQTTLDLLDEGLEVFLPVDALQSRYRIDQDIAFRRLERAGAILTTVETVAFEWLGGADHPHFKTVSKRIQERMAGLSG